MENNKAKAKSILVSDTQLVDILDKYEYLMLHLNTKIEPTITKMIALQKELHNIDRLLDKTSNISKSLEKMTLKIEETTNVILNEKIEKRVEIEVVKISKILDDILNKQNQKTFKKILISSSLSCLIIGYLICFFLTR